MPVVQKLITKNNRKSCFTAGIESFCSGFSAEIAFKLFRVKQVIDIFHAVGKGVEGTGNSLYAARSLDADLSSQSS